MAPADVFAAVSADVSATLLVVSAFADPGRPCLIHTRIRTPTADLLERPLPNSHTD
jgi:hypothetical protein